MGARMKNLYLLTSAKVSMVVRAACETCARSVAAGAAGKEGSLNWRDPERSTCKVVKQDGISGVVLRSEKV